MSEFGIGSVKMEHALIQCMGAWCAKSAYIADRQMDWSNNIMTGSNHYTCEDFIPG